jgi:hypothetical protein
VTKKFNGTPTVSDEVEITNNVANLAVSTNLNRLYLAISIIDKDAWIRLMPSSTDNSTRKGIKLKKDQTYELPMNNIYTGEISIINKKNNEKPKYFVTEY